MKISGTLISLVIAVFFVGIVIGLFIGRNYNHSPLQTTVIYKTSQPALADILPPTDDSKDPLIDINSADFEEFCTLPGIGEVLAQRILDYRAANGPFTYVEELLSIEGMGKQTFEGLLDYITIGG